MICIQTLNISHCSSHPTSIVVLSHISKCDDAFYGRDSYHWETWQCKKRQTDESAFRKWQLFCADLICFRVCHQSHAFIRPQIDAFGVHAKCSCFFTRHGWHRLVPTSDKQNDVYMLAIPDFYKIDRHHRGSIKANNGLIERMDIEDISASAQRLRRPTLTVKLLVVTTDTVWHLAHVSNSSTRCSPRDNFESKVSRRYVWKNIRNKIKYESEAHDQQRSAPAGKLKLCGASRRNNGNTICYGLENK